MLALATHRPCIRKPSARELPMVRKRGLTRALAPWAPLLFAATLAPLSTPASAQDAPQAAAQAAERVDVDLELVLAVDVSLSIDSGEARLQRQGYVQAFRDRQVLEAITGGILGRIAVTYFEWANSRSEEHTSELQSLMRISYA